MVKKWNGKLIGLIVLLTCILFAATAVAKDVKPSATVSIKSTSVAIGIGVQWGDGVLSFKDKEYKFKVEGLSVIDVGVTKIEATGTVYHLDNAADFAGTFAAASADIALGGGCRCYNHEKSEWRSHKSEIYSEGCQVETGT